MDTGGHVSDMYLRLSAVRSRSSSSSKPLAMDSIKLCQDETMWSHTCDAQRKQMQQKVEALTFSWCFLLEVIFLLMDLRSISVLGQTFLRGYWKIPRYWGHFWDYGIAIINKITISLFQYKSLKIPDAIQSDIILKVWISCSSGPIRKYEWTQQIPYTSWWPILMTENTENPVSCRLWASTSTCRMLT